MSAPIADIADHLSANPDSLGMQDLIAQARQMWPGVTDAEIGQAAKLGAERAQRAAAACFAEADALKALCAAKRRSELTVIEGGSE